MVFKKKEKLSTKADWLKKKGMRKITDDELTEMIKCRLAKMNK